MAEIRDNRTKLIAEVQSIQDEKRVVETLRGFRGEAYHSVYYRDVSEGKWRELDCLFTQKWKKKVKCGSVEVRINILVEFKNLKDSNVYVSDACFDHQRPYYDNLVVWPGHRGINAAGLVEIADSVLGSGSGLLDGISARLSEEIVGATADEKKLFGHFPVPPKAHCYTTTFREISAVRKKPERKSVESSVLWRAIRTLNSAFESSVEQRKQHLGNHIREKRRAGGMSNREQEDSVMSVLHESSHAVDIYHPILIFNGNLIRIDGDGEEAIPLARFVQMPLTEYGTWWIDIVTADNLERELIGLVNYYQGQFEKGGYQPVELKIKPEQMNMKALVEGKTP